MKSFSFAPETPVRPSIKQVAHLAGVSIATVSRLLNKPGSVSAETAEKIHRSIAELGFRPNFTGRNLRAGNSRTVGVVVPTLSNTVFAQCLQGIELAARALDYSVMFTTTEYLPEDESAAVELLLGHRVDGVILTVADAGANATLDLLERERIPFVLAYNQLAAADAGTAIQRASVSVDNRAAACDAVTHLIGLGIAASRCSRDASMPPTAPCSATAAISMPCKPPAWRRCRPSRSSATRSLPPPITSR
jgi:DNA-binding LacI/PurR family transcriptional regulator